MININELESRWLKYRIKLFLPYILIFISLTVIITLISIYLSFNNETKKDNNKNTTKIQNSIVKANVKVKLEEVKNVKVINEESKDVKMVMLLPSLDFMDKNRAKFIPEYKNTDKIEEVYFNREIKKNIKPNIKIIEPLDDKQEERKNTVIVSKQNTKSDIEHVKKRFQKSNNPALSLFIAKKYYELGEYNQAYNYALLTNEINNEIDASWIIFAKSLVKLGKKDKAILMLNKYINHSNSNRARILLDNIKSGKMK